MNEQKYLKILKKQYQSRAEVASEIINLSAIKSLPKGTEYFFSDLHGEYEAFLHLLKSASGMIKTKIDLIFGKTMPGSQREELANLIYYPEKTISRLEKERKLCDEWRSITIYQLIQVCEIITAKYPRSKVRKKMPQEFRYIFDELLNVTDDINKDFYFNEIIKTIMETGIADDFISEICKLIQRLAIDQVHIIGDIFDRGPRPDIIMDELIRFGEVDFQWGNHDISWMGASLGNKALIATVIRVSMGYDNFDFLEDGYGINLRPLSEFADKVYKDDPCENFMPHILDDNKYDPIGKNLVAKMHKAIAMIQLKLEGQMVKRHPEYEMDDRNLLEKIDFEAMTVEIDGKIYPLSDTSFPTVDVNDPLTLTEQEEELMEVLSASFKHSESFQKHIRFIYNNGSMYKIANENLMYHGCIPMEEDGSFSKVVLLEPDKNENDEPTDNFAKVIKNEYQGKALLDKINELVKKAFNLKDEYALDFMWYLWCGPKSPLFGKNKMATFEGYFIADKSLKKELYNSYYGFNEDEEFCNKIMAEFSVDREKGHIINGHVPVKIKDGEKPVKAGGKLFIIDGGISKAYQSTTGIAGYTLIYDSHALRLAEHKPFDPNGSNTPTVHVVQTMEKRVNIADTDKGRELEEEIQDLKKLLEVY